MFAFFFRTSWVQFLELTNESTNSGVTVIYFVIIVLISYIMLNLTVGIMCINFSNAVKEEHALMGSSGEDVQEDDEEEGEEEEEGGEEEEDADAKEPPSFRKTLLDGLSSKNAPCCGHALVPLHLIIVGACFILEQIAEILITKVPGFKLLNKIPRFKDGVTAVYKACGSCLRGCCLSINKLCVMLVIPEEEGANTPFNKIALVFMILYLFTLAAQDDAVNLYKCGCAKIDDLAFAERCAVGPKLAEEAPVPGKDPFCPSGTRCLGGYCISEWSGQACINPFANHLSKELKMSHEMSSSENEWLARKNSICQRGLFLHFILLGWAGLFFIELTIRFLGHQGIVNYFTSHTKKGPDDKKDFKPKTVANVPNILDTICILSTVAGIVLTELTFGIQVLNANISVTKTSGEEGWTVFTPTAPRTIKFLRLGVLIRVIYRLVPLVAQVPIVAVIIRGFRGTTRILLAFVLLFVMVYFFTLFGRELFLYYGPDQGCNVCLECERSGTVTTCTDICAAVKYKGCGLFDSERTCNPNICKWISPSESKVQAFDSAIKAAELADEFTAELAKLEGKEPKGKCIFDKTKGGICTAHMSNAYFKTVATFDSMVEGMLLLWDVVIGGNWYANTVMATNNLGVPGLIFFVIFFFIKEFQFLRMFVCIIATNYELNEDEKIQAQEIILNHQFEAAKDDPRNVFRKEYEADSLDDNFKAKNTYDDFSFNKHYMKLLEDASLSLKELMEAQVSFICILSFFLFGHLANCSC
jgi:hypothetical protein